MSSSFNNNVTEEIKSRCNIVDVIGQVVPLKRMGSNFKGVCPFHNEKTPSFVVSETKQIFTCFGCGATGDVFEFVKKYYNLDFPGAIEKLANEYGIEYINNYKDNAKNELYYKINKEAATYFLKAFCQSSNPGLTYMLKRGIEPTILKKFGIGYADGEWDSLYKHFMDKNVDIKILKELGLIAESKGRYYDKFRNRVMFPIINTRGKVIGFGGRAIDDSTPKYLNSSESLVFRKKNNLYGLNLSRQDISKENCAILVEGYMDVISLYQSGIRNVGASLGTALTENQAKMLRRYTKNIILSYDADKAGQSAALRGIDILFKEGCKPKVLHVTDGKDPDEFVKKRGKEAFKELINKSLNFIDYKISLLRKKYDLESYDQSIDFLKEAADILRELSPIEADIYIKKLANEIKISENAIRLEISGNNTHEEKITHNYIDDKEGNQINEKNSSMLLVEKNFIKLMITDYKYFEILLQYENSIKSSYGKKIFSVISSLYKEDKELDIMKVQDALEQDEMIVLSDIIDNVQLSDKEEQVLQECLDKIEVEDLKEKENSLLMRLSMADEEENQEMIKKFTEELMDLQKKKMERGK